MGNQPTSHESLHQILQSLAEDTEGVIQCIIKQRNDSEVSFNPQSNQEHVILEGSSQPVSKLDDGMVGHATELATTKEMLLQRSTQEPQVVSIVGMGGIGKTTMAKKIYDDPLIRSHFDLLGWVTVSQDFDLQNILHDLCSSVVEMSGDDDDKINAAYLANKVRRRLIGQRYLVVVDDIWGTTEWDYLQRCFPDNSNGSRILLTTRLQEVADYTGSGNNHACKLPFLNSNESWELFSQKVSSVGGILPPELDQIGRRIVHKCKGLPLAITVAAGLLSKTNKSVQNWQNIASAINLPMTSDLHEQCSTILTLSYNNLPYHLKACFLYFGVFPKVIREIPTKDLVNLWIAEGFVKADSRRNPEEVAMDYLQDLIHRNLVLISKQSFIGNIKTCRLHDLLLDLCLREVKKDNLVSTILQLDDAQPKLFENANRWLTFQTRFMSPKFKESYNFHKSRTLLLFFDDTTGHCFGTPTSWRQKNVCFKMIRVLDLKAIKLQEAPNIDITEDLILLRYLALRTIMNLRVLKHHHNLQTLIVKLKHSYRIGDINSVEEAGIKWLQGLMMSQKLRYIEYPYPFPGDTDEVPVQHDLHTLYWLPYLQCTKQFVLKIPNVRVLGIRCEEIRAFQTEAWWDNLHYLTKLEKLIVEDLDSEPIKLRSITSFPQSLKKLKIVGTQLSWEAITVISMLPNLESLKICEAFQMGEEWETGDGGFTKLKFLFISGAKLKCWNTMSDHFPVLERLALHYCHHLEQIPMGFADSNTLQLIELKGCYSSLVESAREIQEEQSAYGYDQLLVRDYDTRV